MRVAIGLAAFVLAGTACSRDLAAPGHLVIHIDTDAPLGGDPRAPALFDRLRIELLRPDGTASCASCSRDFDAKYALFAAGVSFTAIPSRSTRARVRLFRGASVVDGRLSPFSTIEVTVALPDPPDEGARDVTVFLPMTAVGRPSGSLDAPLDAVLGSPGPSQVGTWPPAQLVPCSRPPSENEVCVEGGAFWMGTPQPTGSYGDTTAGERLVVVSPFFLDEREVTVGDYRATPGLLPPARWSGAATGASLADFCTYTLERGPRDDWPVNCLRWESAHAYCNAHDGELPSEAQFEYAASAGSIRAFPWGEDDPVCNDAVFGRGGAPTTLDFDTDCFAALKASDAGTIGGVLPVSTDSPYSQRQTKVGGGKVWDLAGNLSEFALDLYAHQADPCWNGAETNLFVDPVCSAETDILASQGVFHAIRGGDWLSGPSDLRATARRGTKDGAGDLRIGFRCTRPAK